MVQELFDECLEERIELWQQCFGDSASYICCFFRENAAHLRCYGYLEGERLVSVAYLLPAEYVCEKNKNIPMYYLYAAATRPECRNKGYFGEVLRYLREELPEPIFLVPAQKNLVSFYEKKGMKQLLFQEKQILEGKECVEPGALEEVTVEAYWNIREAALRQRGYIRWSMQMLRYIFRENEVWGGFCKKIILGDRVCVLLARRNHELLEILEYFTEGDPEVFFYWLCRTMQCTKIVVYKQPDVMLDTGTVELAQQTYFNLTMG